ncbi:MAG: mandelate racemase/muconate lactonizing enzyme family protein [Opitutaceae bacterium]
MKIHALETIQVPEYPNQLYVRVRTDSGHTGLGETRNGAAAVAAWIHESAAPALLGQEALAIERHWRALNPMPGFNSAGAECRGRSALDLAFWDLLGQAAGMPLWQVLGGAVRERIQIYNTCVGPGYTRRVPRIAGMLSENWNIGTATEANPYEDLQAFRERAAELARSLLDQGISAMKIWPFDPFAERTGGRHITLADLERGLEPFRRIRDATGDAMEILVEMHGLWDLPSAIRIASAIEPYRPYWFEDPIKADDPGALAEFASRFRVPTAAGETLGTRWAFRELLERRAVGVVICDAGYAGGISEVKKIAAQAECHQLPVALHDCTGPVNFIVNTHLSAHLPNVGLQEFARAFYHGWYGEIVTVLPPVAEGHVSPLQAPGLGAALRPELLDRSDLIRHVSRAS